MGQGLMPEFNDLSLQDRLSLRGAAFAKTMSGVMRDDTAEKPWRYPLYLLPLLAAMSPGGFVIGIPAALLLLNKGRHDGWPLMKTVHDRLKDAFEDKALVDNHRAFIAESPEGRFSVKNTALTWDTTKAVSRDVAESTSNAWYSLARLTK